MHTFKAYTQQEELPNVQAVNERTAAFIAATRWLTVRLNAGSEIEGVVMTIGSGETRVVLGEGRVIDFYAILA